LYDIYFESQMTKQIDFFLIGAQKCATTWIHHCLNEHPDIYIGGNKKEEFYLGGTIYNKDPFLWNTQFFSTDKNYKIIGSASVEYINDAGSLQFIKQYSLKPKFIFAIRNPVERAISAFFWKIKKNLLDQTDINNYFGLLLDEFKRKGTGLFTDDILKRGFYSDNIGDFIKLSGPENFKIVIYDEIKENPKEAISGIYKFLSVNPSFKPKNLNRHVKANNYSTFLQNIERVYINKNKLLKFVYRGLNEFFFTVKKEPAKRINKLLHEDVLNNLRLLYSEPNQRLINIIRENILLTEKQIKYLESW